MEEVPKKQLWQKYLKLDENCLNTKFKKLNKEKNPIKFYNLIEFQEEVDRNNIKNNKFMKL